MLQLTSRNTPFLYYGDELGMQDAVLAPEHERDPWCFRVPGYGRDPVRTLMAWDGTPGAGFTSGTPWLPVGDEARAENVALLRQGERSWSILHTLRWARAYGALRGATAPGSTREGRRDVPTGQASSSLRDSR